MPAGAGTTCGPISKGSSAGSTRPAARPPAARSTSRTSTPFLHSSRSNWLAAAAELRVPVTDDFNGPQPEGLGCYQVTIRNGRRQSAADAFLRPALRRDNGQARDARLGQQDPDQRGPRRGRRVVARRPAAFFGRRRRSHRVRRSGQFAAAPAAVGHRAGRDVIGPRRPARRGQSRPSAATCRITSPPSIRSRPRGRRSTTNCTRRSESCVRACAIC